MTEDLSKEDIAYQTGIEEGRRRERMEADVQPYIDALEAEIARLKQVAQELKKVGCACDVLNGYVCGIHLIHIDATGQVPPRRADSKENGDG